MALSNAIETPLPLETAPRLAEVVCIEEIYSERYWENRAINTELQRRVFEAEGKKQEAETLAKRACNILEKYCCLWGS